MRTNQGPRACLRRAYAFPLVCKHLSKRRSRTGQQTNYSLYLKTRIMKQYTKPQCEVYLMETEGPLASSDFQVNDEVGGMTQFSKRGVWSSENWMGGDE